ncbi:MAG: hypothetical protein KGD64_02285 [Candidatus Heimdallarchaeota archaeon]|nr:hypothetical protein [Candidatus Heimdallarchaeota archaeon]
MPDITNTDKSRIRSTVTRLIHKIWASPFSEGVLIYSEISEVLYMKSARWRICLKCGTIDQKEKMIDGKHSCDFNPTNFPVLVATSWYKLKEYFLEGGLVKLVEKYDLKIKPPVAITRKPPLDIKQVSSEKEKVATKSN